MKKILRKLLIGSIIVILVSSIASCLCLMPKRNISHNNSYISNSNVINKALNNNNTHTISNNCNSIINSLNNKNYYFHDGFYTQLANNESTVQISGITYLLNSSNNTASVMNINDTSSLVIPGMIMANNNFYNVTSIANGACFNKQLTSVSFPQSIVSIGADAFANNLLTKITLPLELKSLGNNAFSNNPFMSGTVINLPSGCNWNKNGYLAPFNNNNNAGQFARCVKYIIQNLAVYGYVYQSNNWQIVSWMPQVADLVPNEIQADNDIFTTTAQITNPVVQKQTNNAFGAFPTLSLNNASLQDNAIAILSNGTNIQQLYGFSVSNNDPSFYWTNPNYQPGNNFVITISNPNTNQVVYSSLNTYSSNSVPIQYGDVVAVYFNEAVWDSNYRLLTGLQANEITQNNLSSCGIGQFFCCNYQSNNGGTNDFIVTQNGFIPYQNTMHVNVNCLQKNVKDFNLTGIALANHIITATINGQSYQAESNNDGNFSIAITPSSPIALGTSISVSCNGCVTYKNQLVGMNPLNSGFLFQDGGNFGILPDGYTGCYQLWNSSSTTMPLFNNPVNASNTSYSSSSSIVPESDGLNMILTDSYVNSSNQTITSSVTINEPSSKNCASKLNTELQKLTFNPLYINTLTIKIPQNTQCDFYSAIYHKNIIEVQKTSSNNDNIYTFYITSNKLYCESANSYTYTPTYNNDIGYNQSWAVRNFMMVNYNGCGMFEDDYNKANFYDPTTLMWQTVRRITANCQSDYEKAVAINEWVYNNMTYTDSYSYGYTISQTFNHLEGVCGNYADLAAVMCMMAGMVSRIIIGNCKNATSYFNNSLYNHAWMQVWDEQLGSWITLDPTWDWFFPYGYDEAEFNLCRSNMRVSIVFWPPKTNYFSYFTNHMYDALLDYDRFFDIPGGNPESYYPMKYAAGVSQLLQSAPTLTAENSNIIG